MDKNIIIPKQEIAPGIFTTGGTATIPNSALQPNQAINPLPNPTFGTGADLVAGAEAATQGFDTQAEFNKQLELQRQVTPDQSALTQALESLTSSEAGLTGRGTDQLNVEAQLGLPEAQKQRAGLQGQIKSGLAEYNALKAEFDKMSADIEAGAGRKGLTTGAVMGQQGAVDRARLARLNSKASEIGLLQAQDEALAGNIEAAQKIADRAVDLKYQDREAVYKVKQAQYDRIKEFLTAEESKRGKALEETLKKEAAAIAEEKQNAKDIEALKVTAIKNGATPAILDAMSNAKNFDEALKASGGFLADPQTDIVKLDNGNTIMVDKRTGKIIKSFGGAKAEAPTGGYAVTNNALKTVYNNDAVALISNIIKDSKAKPNQQMTDAINVIAGVQELAKANPTGVFPGIAPIRLTPNRLASTEALTNKSNIAAINLKVQQWASGASLTEQQTKAVEKLTPDKNDTDRQVRTKLNALANYMMSQVSGQLAGQGISFTNDKSIDYFAPSSDDQLKELYKDPVKSKQIEQAIQLYPDATADEILQIIE